MDGFTWVLAQGWVSPCQGKVEGRIEGGRWAQLGCFAPWQVQLLLLVEALPTQFEGHLLWVHLHLHLLWVQGAVEEAVRVGEMLLANSHPQLISTCRGKQFTANNYNGFNRFCFKRGFYM